MAIELEMANKRPMYLSCIGESFGVEFVDGKGSGGKADVEVAGRTADGLQATQLFEWAGHLLGTWELFSYSSCRFAQKEICLLYFVR